MVFSSPIFLFLFLPLVVALYYGPAFAGRTYRNVLLLVASLFFYAWGEPVHVVLMLASIAANWGLGLLVVRKRGFWRGKTAVAAAVVYDMGMLFVFKYLHFAAVQFGGLFHVDVAFAEIALPIGISFYSFQALSYVVDVYRGVGEARRNPLDVGLYVSLFPQLIAGPIVRYETVAREILGRRETLDDFSQGTCRFIVGMAKKLVLANPMAVVADMSFGTGPESLSVATAWLGAVAYAFQIYFDFSGYSDMAIGLGRMFGFHFLENFDHPYVSRSVTEFWRRWHISLSTWFRDYVYFPMGGSRVATRTRLVFNLFAVWMLTGIWHGASWTFVLWGAFYFVLLSAEKLTGFARRLGRLGHVYAMAVVLVGWVLFRADTVSDAAARLGVMFGASAAPIADGTFLFYLADYKAFFAAALVCSLPWREWRAADRLRDHPAWNAAVALWLVLVFLLSLSFMIKSDYNPFIYFNF